MARTVPTLSLGEHAVLDPARRAAASWLGDRARARTERRDRPDLEPLPSARVPSDRQPPGAATRARRRNRTRRRTAADDPDCDREWSAGSRPLVGFARRTPARRAYRALAQARVRRTSRTRRPAVAAGPATRVPRDLRRARSRRQSTERRSRRPLAPRERGCGAALSRRSPGLTLRASRVRRSPAV